MEPKFKVGDRIRYRYYDEAEVRTITAMNQEYYFLDQGEEVINIDYEEEYDEYELVANVEAKFKIDDAIVKKAEPNITAKVVGITGAKYYLLCRDGDNMYQTDISIDSQDEWALKKLTLENTEAPEEKLPCIFSKAELEHIWLNNLAQMSNDITVLVMNKVLETINETLKFMDCEAYSEDVRNGMRVFVKELKQRL